MAAIINWAQSGLIFALSFVLVIAFVVVAHEWGHFQVARWLKVRCEVFSIGFGTAIWERRDRHGMIWRLARWPVGGYVKFVGDADASSTPAEDPGQRPTDPAERRKLQATGLYHYQPVWRRAAIVAAGPVASFLLGILIFAGFYLMIGESRPPARVDGVAAGSAAASAGFAPGDIVIRADGIRVKTFEDLRTMVSLRADTPIAFEVRRGEQSLTLTATPQRREIVDDFAGKRSIGVLGLQGRPRPEDLVPVRYGPIAALARGSEQCWTIIASTGTYIGRIFTGRENGQDISGPIAIAYAPGKLVTAVSGGEANAEAGWGTRVASAVRALFLFSAILSISIGMTNLLPIPVLDGGRLVLYGLEALRGRPLGAGAEGAMFRLGFAAILLLAVFATWNDLRRFGIFDQIGAVLS